MIKKYENALHSITTLVLLLTNPGLNMERRMAFDLVPSLWAPYLCLALKRRKLITAFKQDLKIKDFDG